MGKQPTKLFALPRFIFITHSHTHSHTGTCGNMKGLNTDHCSMSSDSFQFLLFSLLQFQSAVSQMNNDIEIPFKRIESIFNIGEDTPQLKVLSHKIHCSATNYPSLSKVLFQQNSQESEDSQPSFYLGIESLNSNKNIFPLNFNLPLNNCFSLHTDAQWPCRFLHKLNLEVFVNNEQNA